MDREFRSTRSSRGCGETPSPSTAPNPSEDEFFDEEPEHECCEHVERDHRGLIAWLAFLAFLFFTIALFVGD